MATGFNKRACRFTPSTVKTSKLKVLDDLTIVKIEISGAEITELKLWEETDTFYKITEDAYLKHREYRIQYLLKGDDLTDANI